MMDILGPSIPEFCILAAIPFLRAWRAQSMLETLPKKMIVFLIHWI